MKKQEALQILGEIQEHLLSCKKETEEHLFCAVIGLSVMVTELCARTDSPQPDTSEAQQRSTKPLPHMLTIDTFDIEGENRVRRFMPDGHMMTICGNLVWPMRDSRDEAHRTVMAFAKALLANDKPMQEAAVSDMTTYYMRHKERG